MMDLFGDSVVVSSEEHDVPEAVAANTLSPNDAAPAYIGHDETERLLLEMIREERLPHALIFSGVEGIGKAHMADRFARFLLSNKSKTQSFNTLDVDSNDPSVRLVVSGGHPDFLRIGREYDAVKNRYKNNIPVSEIRKVPGFLRMTAASGGWRVVIIDDADTMNRNAQNALLKALEEPPARSVLILVAHRIGSFVPTIRSRSQVICFDRLNSGAIKTVLSAAHPELSSDEMQSIIQMSSGSPGQAMRYIEEGAADMLKQIMTILAQWPDVDWSFLHKWGDELGRSGQEKQYDLFTRVFRWLLSDMVMCKARDQHTKYTLINFESLSLDTVMSIHDSLEGHFSSVEHSHLDKRQSVLGAFTLVKNSLKN